MSFSGGLVGTIVSSLTKGTTPALTGAIQNPGSFAIKNTLTTAVRDTGRASLQSGLNYTLPQISGALPKSLQSGIASQISGAATKGGLGLSSNTFATALPSFAPGFLGSSGGVGGILGMAGPMGRQPSLPGVTDSLEPADYGGRNYTLQEVVFSVVPYRTAATTTTSPQTSPSIDLSQAFNSNKIDTFPGIAYAKKDLNFAAQNSELAKAAGSYSFPSATQVKSFPVSW